MEEVLRGEGGEGIIQLGGVLSGRFWTQEKEGRGPLDVEVVDTVVHYLRLEGRPGTRDLRRRFRSTKRAGSRRSPGISDPE